MIKFSLYFFGTITSKVTLWMSVCDIIGGTDADHLVKVHLLGPSVGTPF